MIGIRIRLDRFRGLLAILALFAAAASPARASVTLDFEDIALGPDGTANVFGFYEDPGSGFLVLGDFQARGPGAIFSITPETSEGSGVITTSLAPFGGTTEPAIVSLTHQDSLPFTLVSIDLARENLFNNPSNNGILYPVVTFEGITTGGETVTQTFEVNQEGFYFQTFTFSSDFTNLLSVNWGQPPFSSDPGSPGLHQFDNIVVNVVPEPSTLTLCGLGMAGLALAKIRRRYRKTAPGTAPVN